MPHSTAHSHAGHPHHSEHPHGHVSAASAAALRTAFLINLAFTLVEVVGGWWTGMNIIVSRRKKQGLFDALVQL